jgi:DNA-binding NarL/FixJ family response regulator
MRRQGRGRVIFADDDLMLLDGMASALRAMGFSVVAVGTTDAAVEALESGLADVLLTDIDMPGNQGLELLQRVSMAHPGLPIVILTGLPTLHTAVSSMRLGVADYLTKPIELEQLVQRLDVAVRRAHILQSATDMQRIAETLTLELQGLKSTLAKGSPAPISIGSVSPRGAADPLEKLASSERSRLSRRQLDVVRELARGHSAREIASTLGLSTHTVRNHLKAIFVKLGVPSQVALLGKLTSGRRE